MAALLVDYFLVSISYFELVRIKGSRFLIGVFGWIVQEILKIILKLGIFFLLIGGGIFFTYRYLLD